MLPIAVWAQCAGCPTENNTKTSSVKMERKELAGYNKTNMLTDQYYFTYSFAKKPKMGTSILKVNIYDKKKKISDDFEVYAVSDMPSMRGAHASGDVKLKPNKKGELLVPVNFVMPGIWEIELKFVKDGKQVQNSYFELKI